jgi:ATP-dependent exoDNAse (exonuclease V) beta subunit
MPAKWAKSAEARAQEINLQYVAYTRAKHGLYLLDDKIERAN